MNLGDKLRSLRAIEGSLRGLGRPMTQSEVVEAMKAEVGRGLSQAYLSQIENGARPHMTNTSRELLARFFRVYPGFLVDDPGGLFPRTAVRTADGRRHRGFVAVRRGGSICGGPGVGEGVTGDRGRSAIPARRCCCWEKFCGRRVLRNRLGEVLRPSVLGLWTSRNRASTRN